MNKFLILLIGMVIGVGIGIGGYMLMHRPTAIPVTSTKGETAKTSTTALSTADWTVVTDSAPGLTFPSVGLTFKAPPTAGLGTVESPAGLYYTYFVEKVSDLPDDAPTFGDRATAEADQAALAKGELGSKQYLNPVASTMKLVKLANGANAKTFVSIGGGVDCTDRQPSRFFVTYHNGYRVWISLAANTVTLQQENPSYFANDPSCTPGDKATLLLTKRAEFVSDVSTGKLTGLADTWYRSFDAMVSTVSFTK